MGEASPAMAQTAPGDNAGAQRAPPIRLPPLRSAGIGSNILHRTERMSDRTAVDVLELAARLVSAHVSHNQVASGELPLLIEGVYRSLATAGQAEPKPARSPILAVPVKKSVFPNFIVCLENGKKMTVVTRYLKTAFGITPDQYRAKWNLPHDYPTAAPNHSARRSAIVKKAWSKRAAGVEPEVVKLPARRAKGLRK